MNKRIIAAILIALTIAAPAVYAADITLSSSCTLADAIIAANSDQPEGGCRAGRGADAIILTQDITLKDELPKITSDITIEGNGYTISGDNRWRIFFNDGGALTIKDLTMTKGYVEGEQIINADESLKNATANPIGGAIVNWKGTLTISNSSFSDNLAEYGGGAIYNDGELSISDSTFRRNSADKYGGAIDNGDGTVSISDSAFSDNSAGWGGVILNRDGTVSVSDSTFSGNSAEYDGGAIDNGEELSVSDSIFRDNLALSGGAIDNGIWGELSISSSTFSHNSAKRFGGAGAIDNSGELSISDSAFSHNSAPYGGAIGNGGELSMVNSTFSGNSADSWGGGAINNRGGGGLRIRNSTFLGNSADKGGAIFNGENGKLRMTNSIIAGRGGACYSDSRIRQNISNFIQDGSCSPAFEGDPMLGERIEPADGSPAYFPLLAGSRAIDAADDGYCPETDQIGTARPQGAGCDIGAIEYAAP